MHPLFSGINDCISGRESKVPVVMRVEKFLTGSYWAALVLKDEIINWKGTQWATGKELSMNSTVTGEAKPKACVVADMQRGKRKVQCSTTRNSWNLECGYWVRFPVPFKGVLFPSIPDDDGWQAQGRESPLQLQWSSHHKEIYVAARSSNPIYFVAPGMYAPII